MMSHSLLMHNGIGVLQAALKLSWRSSTKLLIHFGDAPAHGTKYHNGQSGDSHPGGDPTGKCIPCVWSVVLSLPEPACLFSALCSLLQDNDKMIMMLIMCEV